MNNTIETVGLIASVVMPLWNIPLILRIIQRKSSSDISLSWLFGVWICALFMAPSGLASPLAAWRLFNIVNLILFTAVVVVVMRYRKGPNA